MSARQTDEKEFEAADLPGAEAYIDSLPETVNHVFVDVKAFSGRWVFLFGDDRRAVARQLQKSIRGRPFRVRSSSRSR